MKKIGTLNRHLSKMLASLGHRDKLVVCDSGLPIPNGKECVDLALTVGIPCFLDTLRVVLSEFEVEGAVIASEMQARNPEVYHGLKECLTGIEVTSVAHEELKRMTNDTDANISFVRTGEATPYANVILISGVTF